MTLTEELEGLVEELADNGKGEWAVTVSKALAQLQAIEKIEKDAGDAEIYADDTVKRLKTIREAADKLKIRKIVKATDTYWKVVESHDPDGDDPRFMDVGSVWNKTAVNLNALLRAIETEMQDIENT